MAESIWDCRVSSVDWICASCASDADDKSVFAGGRIRASVGHANVVFVRWVESCW